MAAMDFVSEDEYLRASYEPDCDLVDGQIVERHTGSVLHADCFGRALVALMAARDCWVAPVVTLRVGEARYRVADIELVRGPKPQNRWLLAPPLLVVEVLELEDRMAAMLLKIEDYLRFGVDTVWVVDPHSRRGFEYRRQGCIEAQNGVLRAPGITLGLPEIFLA